MASAAASGAIHAWGEGSPFGPLLYLWPTLYAFWFFPLRAALAQMALLGALFAGVRVLQDPGWEPVGEWVATLGGRLGVPDGLLAKRGPLSEEEWHWARSHPEVGARLLETTDFTELGEWILAHHERPDGTGYPQGRPGEEVPLEASILGVADAYEAMTRRGRTARRSIRRPRRTSCTGARDGSSTNE